MTAYFVLKETHLWRFAALVCQMSSYAQPVESYIFKQVSHSAPIWPTLQTLNKMQNRYIILVKFYYFKVTWGATQDLKTPIAGYNKVAK